MGGIDEDIQKWLASFWIADHDVGTDGMPSRVVRDRGPDRGVIRLGQGERESGRDARSGARHREEAAARTKPVSLAGGGNDRTGDNGTGTRDGGGRAADPGGAELHSDER